MTEVARNLWKVQDAIAASCRQAGRDSSEVKLIAVSKTHPVGCLLEAAEAGHLVFGENKVQEFAGKYAELAAQGYLVERSSSIPNSGSRPALDVHLIGHLQSNKSVRAAEVFTSVDTLDSLRLAERLQDAAMRAGRTLPVLLEIKLSDESAKEGLAPESHELSALLEQLPNLDRLHTRGLMTIAPYDADPDVARACFRKLRELRESFSRHHPRLALDELSMGMSGDYKTAIEEGSTQVRIGTAIFGARPYPA